MKIHASIAPLAGETVIVKHFPNSFRETGLLEHLKGLKSRAPGALRHDDPHVRGCQHARRGRLRLSGLLAADACATRALAYGEMKIPARTCPRGFPGGAQILRAGAGRR